MAQREVLLLLCLFGRFREVVCVVSPPAAPAALVQTQRTVMAAAGDDVCLNCQLMQQRDVLQVTWKKDSPEGGERSVATCSRYFGRRVSSTFRGEVVFEESGLQNSSIVIREVTEQDEGCYHCLFNTFPQGALTGTTCLRLQAAQVEEPNSPAEAEAQVTEAEDVSLLVPLVVVLVCVFVVVFIGVSFWLIRKHLVSRSQTDSERIKTPQKTGQTPRCQTPSVQLTDELLRLTSAGKKSLTSSPAPAAGCQRRLFENSPVSLSVDVSERAQRH